MLFLERSTCAYFIRQHVRVLPRFISTERTNQARVSSPSRSVTVLSHTLSQLPFSVYIHWPFCKSKCTYCAFNKYINPSSPPYQRMTDALLAELKDTLSDPKWGLSGRKVNSIYFGGGTPSLAQPSLVHEIIHLIGQNCHLPADTEVSIEANPTSSEISTLRTFRAAGVNRLSLGVQSLNNSALKILGRDHNAMEAINAVESAKKCFPGRVSFDLIFARPDQEVEDWKRELKRALEFADDHLSLYQLTLERGTSLYRDYINTALSSRLPSTDEAAEMYDIAIKETAAMGFTRYEVSSFSRDINSQSKHNRGYWEGLDFVGLGPGAHGRLYNFETGERIRTVRIPHPDSWMAQCKELGHGMSKETTLTKESVLEELLVLGLRTRSGIPRYRFRLHGGNLDTFIDSKGLTSLLEEGFLEWKSTSINDWEVNIESLKTGEEALASTERGLNVIDEIILRLLK